MKIPILLFCAALITTASAQKSLHITHGCAYKTAAEDADLYTFDPSTEAERIVSEICNAVGLSQNFDIRASNVENAMAVVDGERRVILYSNLFLKKFNEDARTRWAAYSVLAHEIGHHLNYHNFAEPVPGKRKLMELEADRFSGSALRLLGANLNECKAGIETFALEGEQSKHPSAKARLESLTAGWTQQQERLEKMGAGMPTSDSNIPRERDTDADGIPDKNDACPEEFGRSLTAGCPDGDEDGIPDSQDKCPYLKGPGQWSGCPDSDGDGLPDHEDNCPREPGQVADKGCPPPDRDGDSVTDRADKCPDAYGLARYQGCPDTDGDGVPDYKDKCPKEKGDPLYEGCERLTLSERPALSGSAMPDNMVFVKGGTFTMGCNDGRDKDCFDEEKPSHIVTLNDFYISKSEVTQAEWTKVMGNNPSSFKDCGNCPVETVSWLDVQEYLKKLNAQNPGKNYRLPTEAEWEYAARGGQEGKGFAYSGSNSLTDVGWFRDNSSSITHPVKSLKANELGLYDMSGNIWEWCSDWYSDYSASAQANPVGSKSGSYRVLRGGSWRFNAGSCRTSYRLNRAPTDRLNYIGFRVAASFQ